LSPPRYVERVSELLGQKLKQAELLMAKKEKMRKRRLEALEEQGNLEPKLDQLVEKTKELQKLVREGEKVPQGSFWNHPQNFLQPLKLQKLIEADVSKRYHGRPVNLMGFCL
ncbi:CK5P3 protein, partial [Turnix velox]|nr:CK5P3 protein [Turnix velox]